MVINMNNIRLRIASAADAGVLSEIYRPYVEGSSVTLEYDPPTAEEFAGRIADITGEFPYLICELDGKAVGYAYAHRYKQRFGYRFCAELSVYIDGSYRGRGLGRRLYGALIELMSLMGYLNLYGVVTDPNPASFALHREFGFYETGREHSAGVKFGEWHDVVIFEKLIGNHDRLGERDCPLRFDRIPPETVRDILDKFEN